MPMSRATSRMVGDFFVKDFLGSVFEFCMFLLRDGHCHVQGVQNKPKMM